MPIMDSTLIFPVVDLDEVNKKPRKSFCSSNSEAIEAQI